MYECYKFNQPIVIPNSTEEIECDFLEECTNFNSTVTINCDNLTSFDMECFMYNSTYKDTTVRFVNSCFYDEGEDIVEYVDCAFCFDGDEGDYKKAGCCTIIVDDKQEAEALENILTEDGEYPLDGCYRYGCYRKVQIMVAE